MRQIELEQALEQNKKLEMLVESLIAMLGRSNQRLDDLTVRMGQIEQFMLEAEAVAEAEAGPYVPSRHEECFSFIARTGNTGP